MAGLNRGSIHLFDLLNRLCLAQVVLLSTYLVVSTSPAAAATMPSGKRCRGDVATQFKMGTPGSGSKRSRKAGTFELQPPRTYTDAPEKSFLGFDELKYLGFIVGRKS